MNRININKVFSVFLALAMILNGYSSGFGSFSIAMVGFIVFCLISFFYLPSKTCYSAFSLFPVLFYIYVVVNAVIQFNSSYSYADQVLISVVKMGVWAFSITFVSALLIDYSVLKTWIRRVSLISSIYIMVQTIFMYGFKIILPSLFAIGPLKINYEIYENPQLGAHGFRPSSFFAEPAFFAFYILVALIIELFGGEDKPVNKKYVMLYTIALFFSTSSSGIFLGIFVWGLYFSTYFEGKKKLLSIFATSCFFVIGILLFSNINWDSFGGTTFSNTFKYALQKVETLSTSGRVGKSFAYLDNLNTYQKLFGVGLGSEASFIMDGQKGSLYMNAITGLIIANGYVGLSIFAFMVLYLFIKSNDKTIRILLLVYVISGYFSGIYFALPGIFYMMVIQALKNEKEIKYDYY